MSDSISVDFFGNLDSYDLWLDFLKEIRRDGVKVHVISGLWPDELKEKLEHHGYYHEIHYDYLHSILAHLRQRGVDCFFDEDHQSWYSDEGLWWEAKAIICQQQKIKIHFDSDRRFEPHFKLIPTRYIFVNYKIRDSLLSLTRSLEESEENYDDTMSMM